MAYGTRKYFVEERPYLAAQHHEDLDMYLDNLARQEHLPTFWTYRPTAILLWN